MSHHRRIDPLKKPTLASMVTDRLRELIVEGAYEAGEQLNEVDLASRFGTSRGPIREGLRQLVHEGLLRSEPHRGAFVPYLSNDDIRDVYKAREAIETAAAKQLIESEKNLHVSAALDKTVQAMKRAVVAREWTRLADLEMRFHTELVTAAGSTRLSRMYATLLDETRITLRMTTAHPGRDELVAEHHELARFLAAGDEKQLLAAIAKHLRDAVELITAGRPEHMAPPGKWPPD